MKKLAFFILLSLVTLGVFICYSSSQSSRLYGQYQHQENYHKANAFHLNFHSF